MNGPMPPPAEPQPVVLRIEMPPLTAEQADAILEFLWRLETAFFEVYDQSLVAFWSANDEFPGCKNEEPDEGPGSDVLDDDIPF